VRGFLGKMNYINQNLHGTKVLHLLLELTVEIGNGFIKGIIMKKCLKFLLIVVTLFVFSKLVSGKNLPEMFSFTRGITRPMLSPTANNIIFGGEDYRGLYILTLESEQTTTIAKNLGAGYGANYSSRGNKIGFKLIDKDGFQQPVYYDIIGQTIVELHKESIAAGVPTFSNNGSIAFTIGSELFVLDKNLKEIFRFNLGYYANLAPISPDGKKVVFNDEDDQFWILELEKGKKVQLIFGPESYFNPVWSHDSKKIAFSSITGFMFTYDLAEKVQYNIGRGSSASWLENSDRIIFCEQEWDEKYQVISSVPVQIKYNGDDKQALMDSSDNLIRFAHYSSVSGKMTYVENNQIVIGESKKIKNKLMLISLQKIKAETAKLKQSVIEPLPELPSLLDQMEIKSFPTPYIHQVYDTPSWFNGHWACGATSAMMALAYYNVLPAWTCNCSSPYFHESKYGRYICETYAFNGYTYNIGGYDPNSNLGYGGYGFIIQNNWADTKGNMAKYARQHGLGSTVDWIPAIQNSSKILIKNSRLSF